MSHTENGENPYIGQWSPYFDDDCMNKILDIPAWQPQTRPEAYPPAQSRLLDHDTPGITTGCTGLVNGTTRHPESVIVFRQLTPLTIIP